jgi:hypothetical protein
MIKILKNWIKKTKCKHDYTYLCSGENSEYKFRFYKCKLCGKTCIEEY